MARGKPICEVLRNLVIDKVNNGRSYSEICLDLSLSKSAVQYIVKTSKESGSPEALVCKSGRKSMITPRDMRRLSNIVKENRRNSIWNLSVNWPE